jgi:hypothetical protein
MRRPWRTRLTAAVLGIWLVLVLGERGLVHICPEHDGAAARFATHPGGDHTPQHGVGAMRHADHGRHAPPHEHHGCTCIGCCVGVTAVARLGHAPTTVFAVEVPADRAGNRDWDGEAVAMRYRFDVDGQRFPVAASAADTFGTAGRLASLDGTGGGEDAGLGHHDRCGFDGGRREWRAEVGPGLLGRARALARRSQSRSPPAGRAASVLTCRRDVPA